MYIGIFLFVPGADLRRRQAGLMPWYGMVDGTSIPVLVFILAKSKRSTHTPGRAKGKGREGKGREGKGREGKGRESTMECNTAKNSEEVRSDLVLSKNITKRNNTCPGMGDRSGKKDGGGCRCHSFPILPGRLWLTHKKDKISFVLLVLVVVSVRRFAHVEF